MEQSRICHEHFLSEYKLAEAISKTSTLTLNSLAIVQKNFFFTSLLF